METPETPPNTPKTRPTSPENKEEAKTPELYIQLNLIHMSAYYKMLKLLIRICLYTTDDINEIEKDLQKLGLMDPNGIEINGEDYILEETYKKLLHTLLDVMQIPKPPWVG